VCFVIFFEETKKEKRKGFKEKPSTEKKKNYFYFL
jgi:hypothetical protein